MTRLDYISFLRAFSKIQIFIFRRTRLAWKLWLLTCPGPEGGTEVSGRGMGRTILLRPSRWADWGKRSQGCMNRTVPRGVTHFQRSPRQTFLLLYSKFKCIFYWFHQDVENQFGSELRLFLIQTQNSSNQRKRSPWHLFWFLIFPPQSLCEP